MLEEEGIGEPCLGKVFLGDQREDSQSKSMTTASTIVLEEEGCLQRWAQRRWGFSGMSIRKGTVKWSQKGVRAHLEKPVRKYETKGKDLFLILQGHSVQESQIPVSLFLLPLMHILWKWSWAETNYNKSCLQLKALGLLLYPGLSYMQHGLSISLESSPLINLPFSWASLCLC